ncbi:MAG: transcription antitermination factor NusB [Firmicutes bacterium]|nr:transcription antitermination factor NusB [Bacillota bacterium]
MSRRQARELAFLVLFQVDLGGVPWEDALERIMAENELSADAQCFLTELVRGALQHRTEVDRVLTHYSVEWPLFRMASTDRNILRLAVYELLYRSDIPVEVTVNEAVELAKRFGEEDSGKFVNGVLGTIINEFRNLAGAQTATEARSENED